MVVVEANGGKLGAAVRAMAEVERDSRLGEAGKAGKAMEGVGNCSEQVVGVMEMVAAGKHMEVVVMVMVVGVALYREEGAVGALYMGQGMEEGESEAEEVRSRLEVEVVMDRRMPAVEAENVAVEAENVAAEVENVGMEVAVNYNSKGLVEEGNTKAVAAAENLAVEVAEIVRSKAKVTAAAVMAVVVMVEVET